MHRTVCVAVFVALLIASAQAGEPGPTGQILREYWENIPGVAVREMTGHASFAEPPGGAELHGSFEAPADWGDNYGTLMRGFVHPPATGEYVFWIAGDDNCELWLSTDANPANKREICKVPDWTSPREWGRFPEQQSKPVRLEAGRRYYIEALHKEGGGGDNLAVGWRLPNGTEERPIPGSRLSPARKVEAAPVQVVVKLPLPLPTKPGHHRLAAEITRGRHSLRLPFLFYVPEGYDPNGERRPLIVFLHGVGERGTDLNGVMQLGPDNKLNNDKGYRPRHPFLGISPQCPPDQRWENAVMVRSVVALLDAVLKEARADADRVYITGLSMGGLGTWVVAAEAPERFAAVVPISAAASQPEQTAAKLKDIPVWIIAGDSDGGFTDGAKRMMEAFKQVQGKASLTLADNCGHDAWNRIYPDEKFYQWLLRHRRPAPKPEEKPAPQPAVAQESGSKIGNDPKSAAAPSSPAPDASAAATPGLSPASKVGPSTPDGATPVAVAATSARPNPGRILVPLFLALGGALIGLSLLLFKGTAAKQA